MASTKRTNDLRQRPARARGFTLFEVMLVTSISAFVFAGVLSAYIFLGRGLARQVNAESLESRSRLALYWFTRDVSTASTITAQNPGVGVSGTLITLNALTASPLYYSVDWSGGASNGILMRQVGTNPSLTLLTNLTSFSIGYYDGAGNAIAAPALAPTEPQVDIKQVNMVFTSTAGVAVTGAQ